MDVKESYIESDLYRVFKNVIVKKPTFRDVTFYDIKDRMPVGDGEADIVIFGKRKGEDVKLVIETKKRTRKYVKKLDPYSVSVIGQALGYASVLSSQFIATSNGDILVVFDAFKKTSILQSQVGDVYKVEYSEDFASNVLTDIAKYLNGELKLLGLDQVFIERIRYFHRLLKEPTYQALKDKINNDSKFSKSYEEWIQKQGFRNDEQTKENIAEQEAYLLMNRILFYKTLEAYQQSLGLKPLKSIPETDFRPEAFRTKMQDCFSYVVDNIDYQAIFKFSEILDEIPMSDEVAEHLNDFIRDIEQYNLSEFDRDIIGDVYQGLIPVDERKRLGQYYTPKEICDLIVRFTINNQNDKVLDPSCGSGGFLVSAYQRLLELNRKYGSKSNLHNKILSQIFGIDINQFATHLSVVNLTLRNLTEKTDKVNIFPVDFFKIPNLQTSLTQEVERESLNVRTKEFVVLNSDFDVVVANPPYTRQDEIGNKGYIEKLRSTALTFYERKKNGKKPKTTEIKVKMSTEAGIFAYFFTHSSHFLKEGGKMGFIVSNSWLDVKFGIDLQKFLLDNFKIYSVIDFDRRVFKDASVNTVVILLCKTTGKNHILTRENNKVKFIRVKKPIKTDELIEIIKESNDSENDRLRIVTVSQKELRQNHKWSIYFKAPSIYYKLANNKKMCKLKDIVNVSVGYVTLANDFFIIPKEEAQILGIEQEFLKPAITKARNMKYLDVRLEDADSYLLFIDKNRNELKGTNVLKYIEAGEQKSIEITRGSMKGQIVTGYQNKPALREKQGDWFKLKDSGYKSIIIPCLVWDRWYASYNPEGVYVNDTFYWLDLKEENFSMIILALLNSTITEFFVELHGKSVYGEGVIQLRKHVYEDLPILNPNQVSNHDERKLKHYFEEMMLSKRKGDQFQYNKFREMLDGVVFDILEVSEIERKELYESLDRIRSSRKEKIDSEVIIN